MEKKSEDREIAQTPSSFAPLRFLWIPSLLIGFSGIFMVYLALREKLTNDPDDTIVAIATCTGALLAWIGIFGVMGWCMLGDFHIHNRQGSYAGARYGHWVALPTRHD